MAKRQLGLAEAFLNAQGASVRAASPLHKRARLSSSPAPASLSTAASSPQAAGTAPPVAATHGKGKGIALAVDTSGPSSPIAFASTLSTSGSPSEADLLALECTSVGPSWLEHLQSELRKPYFLELKRFLWREGLKGTQDRDKGTLKVFPPGALSPSVDTRGHAADGTGRPRCAQPTTCTPGAATPRCRTSRS